LSQFQIKILKNMKSKLFVFMLLTALCAVFTSCSKDDDDDNYGKAIAGTYKGQILLAGQPVVPEAQIVITRDGDKQVTLKVAEQVAILYVDIACKSDVTYKDNKYAISGNTTFDMGYASTTVNLPVKVDGTIDKKHNAYIHIYVENVPDLGNIEVIYDGSRQ
jgi:hypothetical protein